MELPWKEGWTVKPSLEHYRCVRCYMPDANKEIDIDTISLIPTHVPIPNATLDDQLKQTAQELITLLRKKRNRYRVQLSPTTQS